MESVWVLTSLVLAGTVYCAPSVEQGRHVEKRSEVCYGDLGCFGTNSPFFSLHRPLNFLPERPDKINPQFRLYTRQNLHGGIRLNADDFNGIVTSPFSGRRPTKIVVHGFLESIGASWLAPMKDEFLKNGDYNVILTGWGGGSGLPYTQATANTRVVGAIIAKLIKNLIDHGDAKPQDIHLIGHSLGAHIMGYAGHRTPGLGRITGLDPAEPYFQYTDPLVRLDPTDAAFVDVIHTDGESIIKLGFGMSQPCGHVDYYPNNGENQPGCDKNVVDEIRLEGDLYNGGKEFVACNHLRSYKYFTESINSACPWMGYQCDSYDNFERGTCIPCHGNGCGYMGFHADRVKPTSGVHVKYYLDTANVAPFCQYHYFLRVTFDSAHSSAAVDGSVFANVIGTQGQTGERQLSDKEINMQPGKTYGFLVTSGHDIGSVTSLDLRWTYSSHILNPLSWFRHPSIYVQRIEVVHAESQHAYPFCSGASNGIRSETTLRFAARC